MNADARVIAPAPSSCTCSSAADAVPAVRDRSRQRDTRLTSHRATLGVACATGTCLPCLPRELARDRDLQRALLELGACARNQVEHRRLLLGVIPPLVPLRALAQTVDPVDEEASIIR